MDRFASDVGNDDVSTWIWWAFLALLAAGGSWFLVRIKDAAVGALSRVGQPQMVPPQYVIQPPQGGYMQSQGVPMSPYNQSPCMQQQSPPSPQPHTPPRPAAMESPLRSSGFTGTPFT